MRSSLAWYTPRPSRSKAEGCLLVEEDEQLGELRDQDLLPAFERAMELLSPFVLVRLSLVNRLGARGQSAMAPCDRTLVDLEDRVVIQHRVAVAAEHRAVGVHDPGEGGEICAQDL